MKENEFLPIGSIVLLNGGTKKVMITGFCTIPNDNKNKLYDYSGCIYPEGVINSSEICLFNKDQIKEVYFRGYENEEEKDFKDELARVVKEINLDSDHNIIEDTPVILEEKQRTPEVQIFSINDSIFE